MGRYALIIGIAEYNCLENIAKTTADAEAIAQLLEQYGDFQSIKRLPECWDLDKKRFKMDVRGVTSIELCQELKKLLEEQSANNEAFIYFAGHGFTVSEEIGKPKGYLAASDCQVEIRDDRVIAQKYGISLDSFNQLIQTSNLSSLVILLDCCHSGYFLENNSLRQSLTAFSYQKNYYVVTACRSFEEALALRTEKHSLFTRAVLDGLSSKNASSNGQISGDRLFASVSEELKGSLQEPIRMGWGQSIILVTYPPEKTIPEKIGAFEKRNPYRGLYNFELEQEKYFFGRDRAVRTLLDYLSESRFISVIGESGCGKSSLIKAGLFAHIQRGCLSGSEQWRLESFTPGKYPLRRIVDILEQRHHCNNPFVLFIDQFEEVFTLCEDREEQNKFIQSIVGAVEDSQYKTRVIIAIRGNFLERCADYSAIVNLMNETPTSTYIVQPLSRSELQEAIEKPADLHGISFENNLAQQIIDDVINQPGALPLLQYALRELWQVCITIPTALNPLLTCDGYVQIGGVKGALEKRSTYLYQETFTELEKNLVRQLFMELVQFNEGQEVTRRCVSQERLETIIDSPQYLQQIIDRLADQRLIVTNTDTVEVAHETLLSKWSLLQQWIEENRESIRLSRQLELYCREWQERYQRSDEALMTGARLTAIEEWVKLTKQKLPTEEEEYLQKSLEKRDREIQYRIEQERQLRLLAESRQQEAEAKAKAEAARQQAEAVKTKLLKYGMIGAGIIIFLLTMLTTEMIRQRKIAVQRQQSIEFNNQRLLSEKHLTSGAEIEALILSLKTFQKARELKLEADIQEQSARTLQNVLQTIKEKNRFKHGYWVTSVSFSPDAKLIASANNRGTIKLWDNQGRILKIFSNGNNEIINEISFSSDGQIIATASSDRTLKLWDINGNLKKVIAGHTDKVLSVAFSPDGRTLASGSSDKTVKLWSLDGALLRTFTGHKNAVQSVSFHPSGKMIASASDDNTVKLWNLDGVLKYTFDKHTDAVNDVKFSPDGKMIASASSDRTVKLWNLDGTVQGNFFGHTNWIWGVSFSSDSQIIASSSQDGTIKLWNYKKGLLRSLTNSSGAVWSVNFSPRNESLVSGHSDGIVRLWSLNGDLLTYTGHNGSIRAIFFSPDGRTLASGSSDNTVKLWSLDGTLLHTFIGHKDLVRSISFSPDGQMIASASDDNTVKLWSRNGIVLKTILGHTDKVLSVAFSPNGQALASASSDRTVKLWGLDGKLLRTFTGHSDWVRSISFSPDGQMIASASDDSTVKLWNINGDLIKTFQSSGGSVAVTFSPDGQTLASANSDNTINLWGLNGKLLRTFTGHKDLVRSISFSPDGQIIASASGDGTVKLWSLDGTLLQTFTGHSDWVRSISFSPDGQTLASAGNDRQIILWDMNLDNLSLRGCNWLNDYFSTNPDVKENERSICEKSQ